MVTANISSQMVPVEESCKADEPKIIFIVKDETTNDWQSSRSVINLPESTTVDQLINEVAKQFHYCPKSFRLTWESMVGQEVDLTDAGHGEKTSSEMGFYHGRKNTICVKDKDGLQPRRMDGTMGEAFSFNIAGSSASSPGSEEPVFGPLTQAQSGRRHAVDQGDTSQNSAVPLVADSSTSPSHPSSSDYTYSYGLSKSYVGLVNQAMTCYLNSLLQTLYMTPEFRNAVYRWDYDGSMEEEILAKTIPFQLQRLFLALQTSKKRAVETTDITKSFGWDSSEAWQQHDIQELCRILFDALETKWRKTDQRDVINQLYQGKMKDYVKCLECGYESARMDSFLDVPLTVRPFGSSTSYSSVEESLEAFVAAETLDGNNQYFCEKCGKKCDARKGLKFEHFPYVLTMQMKRFDFDYNTLQRIKLNERMTFPEILNLNRFTKDDETLWKSNRDNENEDGYPPGWTRPPPASPSKEPNSQTPEPNTSSPIIAADEADSTVPSVNTVEAPPAPPLPPGGLEIPGGGRTPKSKVKMDCASPVADDDEGIEIESTNTSSSPSSSSSSMSSSCNAAETGPYVYELFSVMIHSGSANGGHYYAYIKSLAEKQWYSFNDQHVQKITPEEVFKTFGGGNGGTRSYYYQSSVNAYMLMYRQIRPENADPIAEQNFPPHIRNIMKREREREEAERKQREIDRCMCKIKLFCLKPSTKKLTEYRFEIHKDKTLKEATREAFELCGLEDDGIDFADVRLVKYDEYHETFERSYSDAESNDIMEKILQGVKSSYMFDLFLEIKPSYASFQTYKPGGTTIKVHLVDLDDQVVHSSVNVRAQLSNSVEEFKGLASRALNLKFVGDSSSFKADKIVDETLQPTPLSSSSSFPSPASDKINNHNDEANEEDVAVIVEVDDDKPPRLPRHVLKSLHCVFERYTNDLRYLANPSKSLKSEGFFRSNKVFISYKADDPDLQKLTKITRPAEVEDAFKTTRLYSLLDTHNHTIRLNVTLPKEAPHPPAVGALLQQQQDIGSRTAAGGGGSGGTPAKSPSTTSAAAAHLQSTCSAPSSVLSAAPSCESGYATSTSLSTHLRVGSGVGASTPAGGGAGDAAVFKQAAIIKKDDDGEDNSKAVRMDTTEATSFYHHPQDNNQSPIRHPPLVTTSSSADNSSASTSSSSTKTLMADDIAPISAAASSERRKTQAEPVLIAGHDVSASSMSPRSSIANSPEAGTVSPLLDRSPVGLESPPAGVSVVGGGKGWSFPETEDPLDDCMLPESASGRVSPAGDPSEGEEDADTSPDNSQANAKLESWRTEMSRNWIRDVNSRQMMNINDEEAAGDGPESEDKDTRIGTWSSKDLDAFAASTRQKFSSVENLAAPSDGTEMWTDSGNVVSGTKDWQMNSGCASPEMMATSPPAASANSAMSCDSASPSSEAVPNADSTAKTSDDDIKTADDPVTSTTSTSPKEDQSEDCERFFKAYRQKDRKEDDSADGQNLISIEVDKRITLGSFKKRLEPWLGTTADNFKVFRVYPNSQEFESTRLNETLTAFSDDGKMMVKYGRALRKGEYRVKVYHLDLDKPNEAPFLLCETVFANEMTVLEAKNSVLSELGESSSALHASIAALPSSRIRLRKRAWKNPGTIYLDEKAFNTDIPIFPNWEVILQVLKEPQPLTQTNFIGVFLRRWRPADFCLDGFQEIFLYHSTIDELIGAISLVSGISPEKVSYAKGRGNFPCEVNLLDIETDLEWDPSNVTALNVWPLYICDDGNVVYYRDKDEKPKELDESQRNALQQQQQQQTDSSRNGRSTTQVTFSPRKERPLRIKVYSESDDAPPTSQPNKPTEKIDEDVAVENASPSSNKKTRSSPLPASCGATDID